MDLSDWQNRLESHFNNLHEKRLSEGGHHPIFALEHDLGEHEFDELENALKDHIRNDHPSWEHRLPWVVYSTEIGYLYSGDQFWQTFEERTPGWDRLGDRYWIRRCFRDFQKTYGGAEPTGTWARHFSIICWPITHAILPIDLQRQLAKLLYETRYLITSEILQSPMQLGLLLAGRSWGSTSRFRQFAQEPLLVGQIATALLLHGDQDTDPLIQARTLERIAGDLERERVVRSWMKGARDKAQQRLRFSRESTKSKGSQ